MWGRVFRAQCQCDGKYIGHSVSVTESILGSLRCDGDYILGSVKCDGEYIVHSASVTEIILGTVPV